MLHLGDSGGGGVGVGAAAAVVIQTRTSHFRQTGRRRVVLPHRSREEKDSLTYRLW